MERGKILVVDDEEGITDLAEAFLSIEGFKVYTAASCKEAFEILKSGGFQAIISDIKMPEMSGIDFIRKLKDDNALIDPFCFITGHAMDDPEVAALKEEGAVANIFYKPFSFQQITEYLISYLEKKQA